MPACQQQQQPEGREEGQGKPLYHHHRYNLRHRFELVRTLGEGTYGKVKLAVEKSTGEQVAIKYIKKTKIQDEADLNRIRREIRILSRLHHPHIVNVREVFEKKDRIILVMDCAVGGELYDYINAQGTLEQHEARRIFSQIAQALDYAHQEGVVHRDLKLENIILDHQGNVKIADFGLANFFRKGELLHTFCGSPLYASPEIVNGTPYRGPEVDLWSMGVVLYTLVHGSMPFQSSDLKALRRQISAGLYFPPPAPTGADSLIGRLLRVDPDERASMEDVLAHPWLAADPPPHPPSDPAPRLQEQAQGESRAEAPVSGEGALRGQSEPGLCAETSFDEDEALFDMGGGKGDLELGAEGERCLYPQDADADLPRERLPRCPDGQLQAFPVEVAESLSQEELVLFGEEEEEEEEEEEDAIFPELPEGRGTAADASPGPESGTESGESQPGSDVSTSGDETRKVFDSERKPRRGILKRRGKFSGGDSGCVLQEDPYLPRPEDWDPTPTLQPQLLPPTRGLERSDPASLDIASPSGAITPSVLPDPPDPPAPDLATGEVPACPHQLPCPTGEGERTSGCPSNSAPSMCTCVCRQGGAAPRRRGILKRGGGAQSDPKKRLSVGSTSSNSSADLLDLSYDSGEGEQFLAMLAGQGRMDPPEGDSDPPGIPGVPEGLASAGGYQPRFPLERYDLSPRGTPPEPYVPRFAPELYSQEGAPPDDLGGGATSLQPCRPGSPQQVRGLSDKQPPAQTHSPQPRSQEESAILGGPDTTSSGGYRPRFPPEMYDLSEPGPAAYPPRYAPGACPGGQGGEGAGALGEADLAGARRRLRELRLLRTRPAFQGSGADLAALNLAGERQCRQEGWRPEGQERLLDLEDADQVIRKAMEICSRVR